MLRRALLRWPRLFVRIHDPDDAELGILGERVAAAHLRARGLRIVGRRVRSRDGEIDLVARAPRGLVLVEVKTGRVESLPRRRGAPHAPRAAPRWRPGGRLDARRLARLQRTARELEARVDLVEVLLELPSRRFRVLHHPGARLPGRAGAPFTPDGPPSDLW